MQHVGVFRMSRQESSEVQSDIGERRLNAGAVFLHHDHVQAGQRTLKGCGVCQQGLESILEESPPRHKAAEDGTSEGDGADKKGDTPLPPDRREYTDFNEDQVLERK